MVRFLATMMLALALCAGVAWYFDLLPTGTPSVATPLPKDEGQDARKMARGGLLYAAINPPPPQPFGDELLLNPNGPRRGRQIVVPDCHPIPFDKQDVSSNKDGQILFIGEPIEQELGLTPQNLRTVEVLVGGK